MFLSLGTGATFLMFKLWGYPFDHEKLKSAAPPRLMLLHRLIGYAYIGIYLYLMIQMVPRLWSYEMELPARTVAHLIFGWSIGVILVLKIAIVRFFKHLESTLVPFLGCLLFICSFLLIALSVPFTLRELVLSRAAVSKSIFSTNTLERVKGLLRTAGLPPDAPVDSLASVKGLKRGRHVLLDKCVQCHDLRTVLKKPLEPEKWVEKVHEMALRGGMVRPIDDAEELYVSAYLIAISPQLQEAVQQKRQRDLAAEKLRSQAQAALSDASSTPLERMFEEVAAKQKFESACLKCHSLKKVEKHHFTSAEDVRSVVARMINENEMKPPEPADLRAIILYLTKTYLK